MDNQTDISSISVIGNIPSTQTNTDNSDIVRVPNNEAMNLITKRLLNNPAYDSKTPPKDYDSYELITPEKSNRALMLDNFIKILIFH